MEGEIISRHDSSGPYKNKDAVTHPSVSAREVAWLLCVLVLGVAVRVFFLHLPMIHDEGGYALAARGWLAGTGRLYDDLWISRPQGIFLVYGFTMRILGYGVVAFRAMAWVFATLTVLAVWLFARRASTPRVAILSALITTLLLGAPTLEGFTANAEIFAGMPAAFAMLWLLRQQQIRWSRCGLIGAGILIGCATILKPSGITLWPAAALWLLLMQDTPLRERLRRVGWLTTGLAIAGIATLLHGWTLGFEDFFYATVLYRFHLQSPLSVGLLHNLRSLGWLFINASEFFMLILLALVLRLRYRGKPPSSQRGWRLLWDRWKANDAITQLVYLWLIASWIGVMMGGDYWTHYLILMVPPVAIWLAREIDSVAHRWRGWRQFVALTMFGVLLLAPYALAADGVVGIYERIYRHPGYAAQAQVSAYIREHTDADETIFVAFDQAAIYYQSDRKPAYRHLYQQELRALPNSYAEIIAILNSDNRPTYIIGTRQPGSFPDDSRAFWREVGRYYFVEDTIDGVPIYRVLPEFRHSGDA